MTFYIFIMHMSVNMHITGCATFKLTICETTIGRLSVNSTMIVEKTTLVLGKSVNLIAIVTHDYLYSEVYGLC